MAIASLGIAEGSPFVRGLVALYVWNKIWCGVEEPLSDAEASVIETLWLEVGRSARSTSMLHRSWSAALRRPEGSTPWLRPSSSEPRSA